MEVLEFFNREDDKYDRLFEDVLRDELFNGDRQRVDHAERTIVTAINTKLERASTRLRGLDLLSNFASKISKENLTKYFPNWMAKIIQILSHSQSKPQELIVVTKTIGALITSCKQVPELDKRISIYIVKQIINIIDEQYFKDKNESLIDLLTVLLYHYAESCARFQASLNSILSSCIDECDKSLVFSGAKCYSLLIRAMERSFQQLSKNNAAVNFDNSAANCHIFYQINLCNNLFAIMDELFQDLVTPSSELPYDLKNTANMHILDLPKIPCDDILEYYTAMERRFSNICIYLSMLIKVGGIGAKKYTLPNIVMQVICQGLSVTPVNLDRSTDRKDLLLLILPKLYTGLLNVLEVFITSFQQELLPSALIIQRLILQTLEWTQRPSQESYKSVRTHAYKVLTTWLKQTKSLSGFEMIAEEYLPHILEDISLVKKNTIVLNTKYPKKSSKHNSKNEKSKETNNSEISTGRSNNVNYTDAILCSQVVLTVQSIISSANCFLKQSFYDKIQNTIVILLYEQYVSKSSVRTNKINTEYRLQLLRTLRTLETHAHNLTPSPTSYAIQIFGIALSQESDPEIVEEANLGLAEVRYIVNPTAPTLELPLSNSAAS